MHHLPYTVKPEPLNPRSQVLAGLDLSMSEFVDLCILMGCDYCGTIKGIGPKTAQTLVQKHKTMVGSILWVLVRRAEARDKEGFRGWSFDFSLCILSDTCSGLTLVWMRVQDMILGGPCALWPSLWGSVSSPCRST